MTPALPEPLVYVLWSVGGLVAFAGVMWGFQSWVLGRIRETFRSEIRSEEFERVIDRRVAAAFDGAVGPLMAGQRDLAGLVAIAKQTADTAHRRIDDYLGRNG